MLLETAKDGTAFSAVYKHKMGRNFETSNEARLAMLEDPYMLYYASFDTFPDDPDLAS